jgi:Uma2 family endonuclease
MAGAAQQQPVSMSVRAFRAWLETRPDEERWELIGGVPVMMTPPTKAHQRIASNLERLLNDALEQHRPDLAVYQRVGLDLGALVEDYDPEPDVTVVDANDTADERYSDRFYLAAEVVSSSDRTKVDGKRDIYRMHSSCACILTIRQDRYELRVDLRGENGWETLLLAHPQDELVLADFGLRCIVADLYRGTPLQRRKSRAR